MATGYLINSDFQVITEVHVDDLETIQDCVGGYIELAYSLPNGDHIFVNEEGKLKDPTRFFAIKETGLFHKAHQMFAGNAVFLGREIEDEDGDMVSRAEPGITLEQLKEAVVFFQLEK